jgi:HD-GYP domain-containing protein (c-di-GMP phosphodiesterase class II)
MAVLILNTSDRSELRYPLTRFPVSIGRDERNDIVLKDEECSRFHIRIKKRGRLYILEDLESKNGTHLNGDRVVNAVIHSEDRILIGTTEFRFLTPKTDIQIVDSLLEYEMSLDDHTGLSGPIDMSHLNQQKNSRSPIRLNIKDLIKESLKKDNLVKNTYSMYANIAIVEEFEEAAKLLLKYTFQLMPSLERGVAFVWSKPLRQLIPVASRLKNPKAKIPFLFCQESLQEVISRAQGVILEDKQNTGKHRVMLPMIRHKDMILILHLEAKSEHLDREGCGAVTLLLDRCSPCFESLQLKRDLDAWMVGMVETMISTVEAKDTYTRGHSERVSKYSLALADQLMLDRDTKKLLMLSAICHDIGKIGIPDTILKKAAMLSADEYNEMKLHPTIGADIIANLPNAHRFISGVKYHHERWDGTGYPEGLEGENIPFFGRIVAIADVFDAMVSGRSYSGFLDLDDAVQKITEEKDIFDTEMIKAFAKAYDSGSLTLKTDTKNQELPEEILEERAKKAEGDES